MEVLKQQLKQTISFLDYDLVALKNGIVFAYEKNNKDLSDLCKHVDKMFCDLNELKREIETTDFNNSFNNDSLSTMTDEEIDIMAEQEKEREMDIKESWIGKEDEDEYYYAGRSVNYYE